MIRIRFLLMRKSHPIAPFHHLSTNSSLLLAVVVAVAHRCCCSSITAEHGETGTGPGGDEEDEGGRNRLGQSPRQGLHADSCMLGDLAALLPQTGNPPPLMTRLCGLCRRAARARRTASSSTS